MGPAVSEVAQVFKGHCATLYRTLAPPVTMTDAPANGADIRAMFVQQGIWCRERRLEVSDETDPAEVMAFVDTLGG